MTYLVFGLLFFLSFVYILNMLMNGAWKIMIEVIIAGLLISIIILAFFFGGWKFGLSAFCFTLFSTAMSEPIAIKLALAINRRVYDFENDKEAVYASRDKIENENDFYDFVERRYSKKGKYLGLPPATIKKLSFWLIISGVALPILGFPLAEPNQDQAVLSRVMAAYGKRYNPPFLDYEIHLYTEEIQPEQTIEPASTGEGRDLFNGVFPESLENDQHEKKQKDVAVKYRHILFTGLFMLITGSAIAIHRRMFAQG